jgi:hypothetical protein
VVVLKRSIQLAIIFLLSFFVLALTNASDAHATSTDNVTYESDCNDPDVHDVSCLEPTNALSQKASKAGYPYYIGHAEPSEPSPAQDGSNVANFELYPTFWLGLDLCDPNSNPFGACNPASDLNNPSTAGAAFLELQFYPPGLNCSNSQWCVRLHINTWEDNSVFQQNNCLEPTTAVYVTTDGTSGGSKFLMNNGDNIVVTIHDTANGIQTDINDLTTSTTGTMVASGANGFVHNSDQTTCATTPFDFHAMYATASPGQVVPWAALGPNVALDFEIGHWELCGNTSCSTLPDADADDTSCQTVRGIGGCFGGDTDHDGPPYQADWPDGAGAHPATLVLGSPDDNGAGPLSKDKTTNYDKPYNQFKFMTTEATSGPFYPFFSQAGTGSSCRFNFGNDLPGTTNDFGKAAQYGTTIVNPCRDVTPPTVTGTPDRSPDSATPPTWYNHQLQVTWSGDDHGGSGVDSCDGPTTYNTPDGSGLSVQGHCTDKQHNVGTGTFAFNYDSTPPTIIGAPTTTPNANNWYKSDVDIKFNCADATSGPVLSFFDVFVTLDGASQSRTGTCNDNAGNSASLTVSGINLDKTPPVVTHVIIPPPNANGWNNANTQVHFTATDALSGIDGASFFDVFFTLEGAGQVASHTFADLAGNSATDSVTINIDKTPPEAYNQFDPVTKDVQVFGRDALSGVLPGPVTPISVTPTKWNDHSGDQKGHDDDGGKAELRTYLISDLAGNTLTVIEKVKKEGHEIDAKMLSLQYNSGPVIKLGENEKQFEWKLNKDGTIKELDQEMKIGHDGSKQDVTAEFDAKKNKTTVTVEKPETKTSFPGLVLLRMATSNGNLGIEFP